MSEEIAGKGCEASPRRLRTDHIDLYQVDEWGGETPIRLGPADRAVRAARGEV